MGTGRLMNDVNLVGESDEMGVNGGGKKMLQEIRGGNLQSEIISQG